MAKKKKRQFHKTTITVEVLSEGSILQVESLQELAYMITEGDCSGQFSVGTSEALTGKQMAEALMEQHSDPEFFGLDESGNDYFGHSDSMADWEENEA